MNGKRTLQEIAADVELAAGLPDDRSTLFDLRVSSYQTEIARAVFCYVAKRENPVWKFDELAEMMLWTTHRVRCAFNRAAIDLAQGHSDVVRLLWKVAPGLVHEQGFDEEEWRQRPRRGAGDASAGRLAGKQG